MWFPGLGTSLLAIFGLAADDPKHPWAISS